MALSFSWSSEKDRSNQKKHGVSFEEAKSVFFDDQALLIADPDHSTSSEERFILLGNSNIGNILLVVHCLRDNDETIRIISSRKASAQEEIQYQEKLL